MLSPRRLRLAYQKKCKNKAKSALEIAPAACGHPFPLVRGQRLPRKERAPLVSAGCGDIEQ